MDSLSWQYESPLWDLIDKNNERIPHYEDIALINNSGGAPMSHLNQKIEINRLSHKGSLFKKLILVLNFVYEKYY